MRLHAPLLTRTLALAILAALLAAVWALAAHPVIVWLNDRQDNEHRLRKLLAGYRRMAAERPALERELQSWRQREGATIGYVDGNSSALAAANLQGQIKRIIESNGGEIGSVQNLAPLATANGERITIHYDLSIPEAKLTDVLYQLETNVPYLFLDNLTIHGQEGLIPATQGGKGQKLSLRCDVHGYHRVGAP